LGLEPGDERVSSLERGGVWNLLTPGSDLQNIDALFPRLDDGKKDAKTALGDKSKKEKKSPLLKGTEDCVDFDYFKKLDLRVAEIVAAEPVKKSKKLLKLTVKAPEERTIVAGIAEYYNAVELIGKQVLIVANLKPVKIMGVTSQGMVLAAKTQDGEKERLVLSSVSDMIVPGSKVA
jgi:methionyl-tRNA synthetase